jgi:hypothetical protein
MEAAQNHAGTSKPGGSVEVGEAGKNNNRIIMDDEGFYVKSGPFLPFEFGKEYPFTLIGDNGEKFEMMAFPIAMERIKQAGAISATTETKLIAHQVTERQKP